MHANKAERFRALHTPGNPIVLFNVWDAGSALSVAKAGARAIATGSWAIAAANGYEDGEAISRELLLDIVKRITRIIDLPVSVDLESGYGEAPEAVAETISLSIEAGAIGCNLEDSYPANGSLRTIDESTARVKAARHAADQRCANYFINARTDVFFQKAASEHNSSLVWEALARAHAYAEAGADGIFVPGLVDLSLIAELTATSPLPVNVMRMGDTPAVREFANAGVARISHGPYPYTLAMSALETAAREVVR
jgi:2-methylisocitrate lyase-like PEP mutase family enzyme